MRLLLAMKHKHNPRLLEVILNLLETPFLPQKKPSYISQKQQYSHIKNQLSILKTLTLLQHYLVILPTNFREL